MSYHTVPCGLSTAQQAACFLPPLWFDWGMGRSMLRPPRGRRSAVNQLVLKKREPSADEIIDQDASAALSGLGSIEQLTTASAEAAA